MPQTRNITDFGASTTAADNGPAIRAAIASLADGDVLLFPAGRFVVEPSLDGMAAWEVFPVVFRLPDKAVRLAGVPGSTTLVKGPAVAPRDGNAVAMFATAYGGTAAIRIEGVDIEGTGNSGVAGCLIDGLLVNGSRNGYFDLDVRRTKRHCIHMISGADRNVIRARRLAAANREQLGCGLQIEGGSGNIVDVDEIADIGANGLDINEWVPELYHPTGGGAPYPPQGAFKSTGNLVRVGRIDNVGFNNHLDGSAGFGTFNGDDDYYGVNVSNGSDFNTIRVGEINRVRVDSGTIAPRLSSYASAIRIWQANGNTVRIDKVRLVGPGNAGWLVRLNGPTNGNVVEIEAGFDYFRILYDPDRDNTGNSVFVRNAIGTVDLASLRGLDLRFVQQATTAGTADGRISGWSGAPHHVYSRVPGGIRIADTGGTFESLTKTLRFTYNYVVVDFFYNMSGTPNAVPVAAMSEPPFTALGLRKDGLWHHASILVVQTDGEQTIGFSPNAGGAPAPGAELQLAYVTVTTPTGTVLHDPGLPAQLRGPPTIGAYELRDRVENYAPAAGQPTGWRCVASGVPGTWLVEGAL